MKTEILEWPVTQTSKFQKQSNRKTVEYNSNSLKNVWDW